MTMISHNLKKASKLKVMPLTEREGKHLFNSISTNTTRYGVADKFENLYHIINAID